MARTSTYVRHSVPQVRMDYSEIVQSLLELGVLSPESIAILFPIWQSTMKGTRFIAIPTHVTLKASFIARLAYNRAVGMSFHVTPFLHD
jgi:hypothetical protein